MPHLRTLTTLALACFVPSLYAQQALHLIPIPRTAQPGALQPIPQGLRIACPSCPTDPADNFTSQDLAQTLTARAIPTTGPITITLSRAATLPPRSPGRGLHHHPHRHRSHPVCRHPHRPLLRRPNPQAAHRRPGPRRRPPPGHRPRLARDEVPRTPRRPLPRPRPHPSLSKTPHPAASRLQSQRLLPLLREHPAVRLQPAPRPPRRQHLATRRPRALRLRRRVPHHHHPGAGSLRPSPPLPPLGAVPAPRRNPPRSRPHPHQPRLPPPHQAVVH